MVTQPPVESYFTCSLHFSKPNGRKQMILLFNLLVINSNDSTLFCGPADKIDTFSHLFLPNSRKTSKSSTYVLHYLFSHLHKKPRLTCPPGLLGNNGIWRFLWLLKKAAVEAKQYLSRKLASIEHVTPVEKKSTHTNHIQSSILLLQGHPYVTEEKYFGCKNGSIQWLYEEAEFRIRLKKTKKQNWMKI